MKKGIYCKPAMEDLRQTIRVNQIVIFAKTDTWRGKDIYTTAPNVDLICASDALSKIICSIDNMGAA